MPTGLLMHALARHVAAFGTTAVLLVGPAAIAAAQTPQTSSAEPAAQPVSTPAPQGAAAVQAAAPAVDGIHADDLRRRLEDVLSQYPPTLREVLRNDPSLLTDERYLEAYPALAAFVRAHPQVARNVRFYVGDASYYRPSDPQSRAVEMWNHLIEMVSIFSVILLIATAIAWLVRTALDHRRWLRASKIQVDVHQKLFDRLSSNDDLLTYLQTPAGQRFLEASPAPVVDPTPSPRAVSAPINRILWSVQIGIVLLPLGLGLQWVAGRVVPEVGQLLWFLGVLGLTVGLGFVGSAGVAYVISKRLGLIRETSAHEATHSSAPLA